MARKTRNKRRGGKKGTRVYRCVHKLKKKYSIGKSIAICQKSTQQGYKSGKKLVPKKGGGRLTAADVKKFNKAKTKQLQQMGTRSSQESPKARAAHNKMAIKRKLAEGRRWIREEMAPIKWHQKSKKGQKLAQQLRSDIPISQKRHTTFRLGRGGRRRRRTRRRKRRAGAWCRCTEAEARAQKKSAPTKKYKMPKVKTAPPGTWVLPHGHPSVPLRRTSPRTYY